MTERALPQQERVEHAARAVVGARYVDPLANADRRRSTGKRRQASIHCQTQTCALRSKSYFVDANAHVLLSVVLFGAARYKLEGAADRDTNA